MGFFYNVHGNQALYMEARQICAKPLGKMQRRHHLASCIEHFTMSDLKSPTRCTLIVRLETRITIKKQNNISCNQGHQKKNSKVP
jgi:hypothetical protein